MNILEQVCSFDIYLQDFIFVTITGNGLDNSLSKLPSFAIANCEL